MCLIGFAFRPHDRWPLIIASNRDEWRVRPTAPAHWWADESSIFAGRDLQAGGTWLGLHRRGRLATVTNVREGISNPVLGSSRGELVTGFLGGTEPFTEFQRNLAIRADHFSGFNLLLFEWTEGRWRGAWQSNRSPRGSDAQPLEPGFHAMSNHLLNSPWPKVERLRNRMRHIIEAEASPEQSLLDALADAHIPDDADLPDTGVGLARERLLSAALIADEAYGTRASTVIQVSIDGWVQAVERSWVWSVDKLKVTRETRTRFRLSA